MPGNDAPSASEEASSWNRPIAMRPDRTRAGRGASDGGNAAAAERGPCPRRAARECAFTLLVPRPYWDPDTDEATATLELAIPLLEQAVGGRVDGVIGDSDPFVAVRDAVTRLAIDEIIISTLPARVSQWLRRDLPRRVEQFGLPVTVVTAQQSERVVASRGPGRSSAVRPARGRPPRCGHRSAPRSRTSPRRRGCARAAGAISSRSGWRPCDRSCGRRTWASVIDLLHAASSWSSTGSCSSRRIDLVRTRRRAQPEERDQRADRHRAGADRPGQVKSRR